MTFTDGDLVRFLLAVDALLTAGIGIVLWWGVRIVVNKLSGLENLVRSEMRAFDTRITRLETIIRIRRDDGEFQHDHLRVADA